MINILLCDDDEALCKSFETDIREYFFGKNIEFNVKSIYTIDELEDNITGCDILFLDVIINEQNSINLIADSGKTLPCQTVIVTSYPGEIYNIFHISPAWYIDKVKYKKEHLHSALDKCLENISKAQRSKIIVNCDKIKQVVDLRNVMYIETQNKSIILHFADGTTLSAKNKISEIAELGGINFQQCSRYYAVNFDYVTAYIWHKYILQDKTEIIISRKSYKDMISQYRKYLEI